MQQEVTSLLRFIYFHSPAFSYVSFRLCLQVEKLYMFHFYCCVLSFSYFLSLYVSLFILFSLFYTAIFCYLFFLLLLFLLFFIIQLHPLLPTSSNFSFLFSFIIVYFSASSCTFPSALPHSPSVSIFLLLTCMSFSFPIFSPRRRPLLWVIM